MISETLKEISSVAGKTIYPHNAATTVSMFTWCLLAIVISYAFTSSLIAGLSVQLKTRPPETFQELVEQNYIIKPFTRLDSPKIYEMSGLGNMIMVGYKTHT